jgi:hypothetical protein
VIGLGIRSYVPEVQAVVGGAWIPLLNVPAAGLYYVPVFMTLTISFYKYWLPTIEQLPLGEPRRAPLLRRFVLSFAGVFFFELMIEPMVENRGFPAWSYVYRDITVLMTLLWVVVLTLGSTAVDRLFPRADLRLRFAAYLAVIGTLATPIEAWFINAGLRVYGPSASGNFSGFKAIVGNIPIEVALGIPLYLALVIAFVRYWERIDSYQVGLHHRTAVGQGSLRTEPAAGVS